MHGNEGNLEQIIDWKMEGKSPFRGLYECRRIILRWILRNCISMNFDYLCFGRALSDILMNFVINRIFSILWGIS